jgi:anti-sigma B factor antagonist
MPRGWTSEDLATVRVSSRRVGTAVQAAASEPLTRPSSLLGPVPPLEVAVSHPSQPVEDLPLRVTYPAPDSVVLHVEGEVDTLTAPTLDTAVTKQLDTAPANLVLDFTGVSFLGSSGLAVLIRAANAAAERDIRLALVTESRAVLRPLDVTRTTEHFTIHSSVETALADGRTQSGGTE